jgi:hypothetical protein
MEHLKKLRRSSSGTGAVDDAPLKLPDSVPQIDSELVEAACRKNPRARRLHERLQAREEAGKPMTASEVDKMVKAATGPDGTPDGEQAIIIAEHAQRNPRAFNLGHHFLLKFLARIAWQTLISELRDFLSDVREQDADVRKREELKRSLEKDRLDVDARRATLLRMDRAKAAMPPVDPELDAENRLQLMRERMRRT